MIKGKAGRTIDNEGGWMKKGKEEGHGWQGTRVTLDRQTTPDWVEAGGLRVWIWKFA